MKKYYRRLKLGIIVLQKDNTDSETLKSAVQGDWSKAVVERKFRRPAYINKIADIYFNGMIPQLGAFRGRKSIILCAGVKHAIDTATALNKMPIAKFDPARKLRDRYIERFADAKQISLGEAQEIIENNAPDNPWRFCISQAIIQMQGNPKTSISMTALSSKNQNWAALLS